MLTVLGLSSDFTKDGKYKWDCVCDCGNTVSVSTQNIKRQTSCGCVVSAHAKYLSMSNITHGCSGKPIYAVWKHMLRRCSNPKDPMYYLYGGRGIRVTKRWLKFENFFVDMGHAPAGKTLDRVDNNKGYCPSNCRWATPSEQAHNRRTTYVINGKTIAQLAEAAGVCRGTMYNRIRRGWSVEDAANTSNRKEAGVRDSTRKVTFVKTADAVEEYNRNGHKPKKK